jgi:hypothetical protein
MRLKRCEICTEWMIDRTTRTDDGHYRIVKSKGTVCAKCTRKRLIPSKKPKS